MRSTAAILVLSMLTSSATTGCANNNGAEQSRPPAAQAVDRSRTKLHRSLTDAYERSDRAGPFVLAARWNPPRCDAPEFEVHAHGRWRRAYLEGSSKVEKKIETFREESEGSNNLRVLSLEGKFQGRRRAETGLKYPVFRVVVVNPGRAGGTGASSTSK